MGRIKSNFSKPMAPLLKCSVFILLTFVLSLVMGNEPVLRRQKREWITAPRQLKENHDYTSLSSIARIRSDKENYTKINYYLSGPGVDQPPEGIFRVDRETGFVKIFAILDRENIPVYNLKGRANYADGSVAENEIVLKIIVVDENDCPPVIKAQQIGSVSESSAAGTVVMKVIATDADQENTPHSSIFYRIVESSNSAGMFSMNARTGEVRVQRNTLDRESKDTYTLMIQASDMNGQAGGNAGTGEISVKILDINDNIPTLAKESYEGSVRENTANMEVMRVQAVDMDLIHSDNWLAVYEIVSGNEAGYFSMRTDSNTNEGIIMINKALDFEEHKVVNLDVAVSNKAQYNFGSGASSGSGTSKSYPIKINVVNEVEGPRFHPGVKVVTLSEDSTSFSRNEIITTYSAIDSDTLLTATNVRYAKIHDQDNWLVINEKTADIRLNKLPDRESKFLINGTYYAEIICITNDSPSKTATGTIAIQVKDLNDDCPKLTSTTQTVCLEANVIYITAVDHDEFPNSVPFEFNVIRGSSTEDWRVEPLNETSAILRHQTHLWPGAYKVTVEVKDQQGVSCDDVQVVDVIVCTCDEITKTCRSNNTRTSTIGAAGILLLLLGLLLLLLLPCLLLFCLCGGAAAIGDFKAIPYDTKQQLISYHTEGQGEDKEVPLLLVPVEVDGDIINTKNINNYESKWNQGGRVDVGGGAALGGAINSSTLTHQNIHQYNQYNQSGGHLDMDYADAGMMTGHLFNRHKTEAFHGMALSEEFLAEYYSSKSSHAAQQSQQKDNLLVYDYEGQESPAGSIGCCSLLENDNDLAFLNDIGSKFKTLAEICQGSVLVSESVNARFSRSPPRPVSPIMPSISTHTHVHTERETIRDRDHVNINTLDTSNVVSGSSTIIQEERITERAQGSATFPSVQDKIVIPSQRVLIQQPTMYYTAAPMYVVEPKSSMVLVGGGTQQVGGQVGQIGLSQGLMQLGTQQAVGQIGLSQGLVQVGTQQTVGPLGQIGLGQGLVQVGTQQAVGPLGQIGLGQGLVQVGTRQTVGSLGQIGLGQGLVQVGTRQTVGPLGQIGLGQGLVQVGTQQTVGPIGQIGLGQGLVQVGTQQTVGSLGQIGLGQGLVQVGGLQGTQSVVLVDRQIGMGGVTGHVAQDLSHGTSTRSRKVLVENGSSGGEQAAHFAQGIVQRRPGSSEQGLEVRHQGKKVKTQSFSVSSHESAGSAQDFTLAAPPKIQGSQKVIVQHKKVSVTERNMESNTRA